MQHIIAFPAVKDRAVPAHGPEMRLENLFKIGHAAEPYALSAGQMEICAHVVHISRRHHLYAVHDRRVRPHTVHGSKIKPLFLGIEKQGHEAFRFGVAGLCKPFPVPSSLFSVFIQVAFYAVVFTGSIVLSVIAMHRAVELENLILTEIHIGNGLELAVGNPCRADSVLRSGPRSVECNQFSGCAGMAVLAGSSHPQGIRESGRFRIFGVDKTVGYFHIENDIGRECIEDYIFARNSPETRLKLLLDIPDVGENSLLPRCKFSFSLKKPFIAAFVETDAIDRRTSRGSLLCDGNLDVIHDTLAADRKGSTPRSRSVLGYGDDKFVGAYTSCRRSDSHPRGRRSIST